MKITNIAEAKQELGEKLNVAINDSEFTQHQKDVIKKLFAAEDCGSLSEHEKESLRGLRLKVGTATSKPMFFICSFNPGFKCLFPD